MRPLIFEQEQIARAAELGLGVPSADAIELVPADDNSFSLRNRVTEILKKG
jgi:hypothetical protein